MNDSCTRRPRPSLIALAIILLGAFLVIPASASAGDGDDGNHGIQRFAFLSTDPADQDTPDTVIATGPIHAKGTVTTLSPTEDVLTFPDGTLTITHEPKTSNESFDPVTCLFRFSERGTYLITGGTGAYEDAEGHGKYRVKVLGVSCAENAPPELVMVRIFAKGPIHF
jgi:hypothetical protein